MDKIIKRNLIKTYIVIFLNICILALIFFAFSSQTKSNLYAATISISLSIFINILLFIFSNKIILSINQCKKFDEKLNISLSNKISTLSKKAGIVAPNLYIIEDKNINSLSTGISANNSNIIITQGAINNLTSNELDYMLLYELIKISKRETEFYTVSVCTLGLIAIISDNFFRSIFKSIQRRGKESESFMRLILTTFFFIFAPMSVKTVELFVSRKSKLFTDKVCIDLGISNFSITSTLNKIKDFNSLNAMYSRACCNMFFTNPLIEQKVSDKFSSHIPLDERIEYVNKI